MRMYCVCSSVTAGVPKTPLHCIGQHLSLSVFGHLSSITLFAHSAALNRLIHMHYRRPSDRGSDHLCCLRSTESSSGFRHSGPQSARGAAISGTFSPIRAMPAREHQLRRRAGMRKSALAGSRRPACEAPSSAGRAALSTAPQQPLAASHAAHEASPPSVPRHLD